MTACLAPHELGHGGHASFPDGQRWTASGRAPMVTRHERRRCHPYSRSVTHLSHSETVGDAARGAPHRSPPQYTSVTPACWAGVRVGAGRPALRWYETCGRERARRRGVLCVRHACCTFVGRTRRLARDATTRGQGIG